MRGKKKRSIQISILIHSNHQKNVLANDLVSFGFLAQSSREIENGKEQLRKITNFSLSDLTYVMLITSEDLSDHKENCI